MGKKPLALIDRLRNEINKLDNLINARNALKQQIVEHKEKSRGYRDQQSKLHKQLESLETLASETLKAGGDPEEFAEKIPATKLKIEQYHQWAKKIDNEILPEVEIKLIIADRDLFRAVNRGAVGKVYSGYNDELNKKVKSIEAEILAWDNAKTAFQAELNLPQAFSHQVAIKSDILARHLR